MNRVRIDPNVRVRGNQTFSGFEDCDDQDLEILDIVEAYEEESGVHASAVITDVDHVSRLVYLKLDWSDLAWPESVPKV